jgi:uncharacterized membrane protein YdjX (TVP38/TMEM64 family)
MSHLPNREPPSLPVGGRLWWPRFAAMAVFVVVALATLAAIAAGWHKELTLEALIRHRTFVNAVVAEHRLAALAVFVAGYAIAAGSSLPGVVFLTIGAGAVFGGTLGGFAAVAGATAGATAVFLLARTAVGGALARRAGPLVERFADGFRQDAFNYLLFMRLVPVFPFWLVNVVPALCGVRLATYVAATALGIVPMTLAFAFFGAGLDSVLAAELARYRTCTAAGETECRLGFELTMVLTPQFIAGIAALGIAALIPVAVRRWRARRSRNG